MENNLKEIIGNTDIYLVDQILKSRFKKEDKILDVGCGKGRNIQWFYHNNYNISGVDKEKEAIIESKIKYPGIASNLLISKIENILFKSDSFDHIICNAVLHFADNTEHFLVMLSEIIRVLKNDGTLFIRMTSDIGIKHSIKLVSEGVYLLPDGTHRFLLTKELLNQIMTTYHLTFLEPIKTVNVNDLRSMTTLVLQKQK